MWEGIRKRDPKVGPRINSNPNPYLILAPLQSIPGSSKVFLDHIWPFFANHMFIFHKTEIQTVILRCLTILNLNWYKSYDKNTKTQKMQKMQTSVFVQKNKTRSKGISNSKCELEIERAKRIFWLLFISRTEFRSEAENLKHYVVICFW